MTTTPIEELLAPLLAAPEQAGAFFDLDGTLAEIVARPEGTALPERTRRLLALITERFALAGIVTGRPAAAARRIAGLDELTVVGNHGIELLGPGEPTPRTLPEADRGAAAVRGFASELDAGELGLDGLRLEDKGPILALHWRGAEDEERGKRRAVEIAARAEAAGLTTHRGRKVIELRPDLAFDKGRGLAGVLAGRGVRAALFAGDDRTDVDGFEALGRLREEGELDAIVRIAVLSPETPGIVAEHADLAVEGPDGLLPVLELLAGEG